MSTNDPWNIGTLHKSPIWVFYSLSNFVGVMLCTVLVSSVYHNPKRTASDIFVAGLASGCMSLSMTCGGQCFANVLTGRFYGGQIACQIEAIAHISSILTEFFCVAAISLCTYLQVIHKKEIEQTTALRLVVGIWCGCVFVTGLSSLVSPIYLMSAGTYCFFGFSSFAIAGWLLPGLVVAITVMFVCHCKILSYLKHMLVKLPSPSPVTMLHPVGSAERGPRMVSEQDLWRHQFKWRSTMFIAILLLGWGFAAITAIYELTVGPALEWLVTAVGVGGVSFSWAMPLTYALTSKYHKMTMIRVFGWIVIPCFGRAWWLDWRSRTNPDESPKVTAKQLGKEKKDERKETRAPSLARLILLEQQTSTVPAEAHLILLEQPRASAAAAEARLILLAQPSAVPAEARLIISEQPSASAAPAEARLIISEQPSASAAPAEAKGSELVESPPEEKNQEV